MSHLEQILATRVTAAVRAAYGVSDLDPQLQTPTRPEFGHYQTNVAFRLAQRLGSTPRPIAELLLKHLDVADLCEIPQVAGAGFINFRLRPATLVAAVSQLLADPRLGVPPVTAQRIVIDYSSPNVAKAMHVGHLRSTVIGDALSRMLAFVGHDVVRQNHVGDWGTQFGMLIELLLSEGGTVGPFSSFASLYARARARFDTDPVFATAARQRVVALQNDDPATHALYEQLAAASLTNFQAMYARLGAALLPADVVGESAYNDQLPGLIDALVDAGVAVENDGALCVFLPGFVTRTGAPLPMIVRKSDGGYGYDATDLAALRHRVTVLHADQLIYVVDARQALHFDQVFALARAMGWLPEQVSATHVAFGMVLGADGRPLKTRAGGTPKLSALLNQAVAKANRILDDRSSHLSGTARVHAARAIGVGAVKYADLSSGLGKDYTFVVDRLAAMDGNTGPYLQYAHVRLCSILRKAGQPIAGSTEGPAAVLTEPAEERLALCCTQFADALLEAADALEPHRLCTYLYELASLLSGFYEACPVLTTPEPQRSSRLALCSLVQQILACGLTLLGIEPLEVM